MRFAGRKKVVRKVGKLRRGQLISTFGCGAIVDLPGDSVIIAGTDFWKNHEDDRFQIYEENLQKLLGADYFVCPPGGLDEEGKTSEYGIPAFRFPTWMYCPKCKRLAPAQTFGFRGRPKCGKCSLPLVPSRFVVACENGHLDDFPYVWWVHYGGKCDGKRPPELFIEMSEERSGLDGIIIKCKSCGKTRTMAGSFIGDSLKGLKCTRRRPWLNDYDPAECEQKMRTVQRGATNLHFCINISALSIPPWSKRIQIELSKNWHRLKPLIDDRVTFENVVTAWNLPRMCGCTAGEVWEEAVRKQDNLADPSMKSWQDVIEDEYRAFLAGNSDENGEFKTRRVAVPDFLKDYVDDVVLATRLREVMALRGFKRINPEYDIDDYKSFTMLSRDFKNWLPGIELKGEGIFIKLNAERLREWESRDKVLERYRHMQAASGISMVKGPGFSPRYVLMHTISHLLIRQLILQCGYASAAIKERIYCTFTNGDAPLEMSGILIYTSTNDSEGSLGGLVREGEPRRLDSTFRQMLEAASWCSADPLCIQSKGQGINALNLAACHSCTLLPETSCEMRNCYLDRAALIGTLDDSEFGFFSALLHQED
jgi:hypothetical protein